MFYIGQSSIIFFILIAKVVGIQSVRAVFSETQTLLNEHFKISSIVNNFEVNFLIFLFMGENINLVLGKGVLARPDFS